MSGQEIIEALRALEHHALVEVRACVSANPAKNDVTRMWVDISSELTACADVVEHTYNSVPE